MSSSLGDLFEIVVDSMCPGGVLVVASPVVEAAVQDADPSVSEGAESFVV
jgi:hypothetical protein